MLKIKHAQPLDSSSVEEFIFGTWDAGEEASMSERSFDPDDSMMSLPEKLAYIDEIRETFGEEAADLMAEQMGVAVEMSPSANSQPERVLANA